MGGSADNQIESYLQSDAELRAGMFPGFMRRLREEARGEGGAESTRAFARRAVTPDLDYTSLRAIGGFLQTLPGPADSREKLRLAVLGGPTTKQLTELLKIFLAGADVPVEIHEGEYGIFRQEILAPGPALDQFQPKIVFLATGANDTGRRPSIPDTSEEALRLAEEEYSAWSQLWQRANERWGAVVIQNTFEITPWSAMGHYALRHAGSSENYLSRLNSLFAGRAPSYVTLHDLQALALEVGAQQWFDPRFYLEAKMPCGPESLVQYAHSVSRVILAILGKSKKVLVLDLDNTLWGGVVGDAGIEGIEIGQGTGVGEAFVEFQKYAVAMRDRGVLLAACSKNEESVARSVFEKRDEMVLKLKDFSCFLANWRNKADNLREIARTLELGLDSLVFVDDHPGERALVRRLAPEVAVPSMPEDPGRYVMALARYRYFETVAWTSEDARRAEYYQQNAQRREMAAQSTDIDTFLASLDMQARIEPVQPINLERVTQLTNKSNQFNLTTRRRTQAEIAALAADEQWSTLTVSLADKLGDNGLISVVFLKAHEDEMEIDTWLMSCRVLQRGVEELVLNQIAAIGRARKCTRVRGVYIPTERNGLVRDLLPRLGFVAAGENGKETCWTLAIDESFVPRKTCIQGEMRICLK